MPADLPVTDLIAQARAGNAAALDRLFACCRDYLVLMARARVETWLRAKVDASDLVQQTMMEAYRGFDRFHGGSEGEWLAWLRGILDHNAADFVRHYQSQKRKAGKEVPLAAPMDDSRLAGAPEPAAPGDSPSQALARVESELELVAALAQLPPDYQEVIVLRNLQKLPFDEVAKRMDRSRPATQMLWMRAIHKLQEVLQPQE
ncbi:MAG TPA: sigma-70 family RNA polymerase sigma factor [Gemmataceae bacterium]|jgi:RNA polymerase sigma-70 factor (ECF subfamily)|nr:sigma-70 family RNA polymerase sigma factor [Gemmataceae bacterium]